MNCSKDGVFNYANEADQGCCLSCQCGDDCFAKGNCCIDKEHLRPEQPNNGRFTLDGRTCIETFFLAYKRQYMPSDRLYLLSQTCLNRSQIKTTDNNSVGNLSNVMNTAMSDFVDIDGTIILLDDVITGCTFPDDTNVHDVTPVTSVNSGNSYRNIYCAFCNNDGNNRIEWDISVKCLSDEQLPEILFNGQATKQQVYLAILGKKLCSIFWNKPSGVSAEKCFLSKYMVSDCPPYVPELISDLCKSESFVAPYPGKASVYRNIFCFICNFYEADEISLEPVLGVICLSDMNMGQDHLSMSFLLDFETLSVSKTKALLPETRCGSLLTYNADLVCLEFYLVRWLVHCTQFCSIWATACQ